MIKKKWLAVPLCAVFVFSAAVLAACGGKTGGGDDDGKDDTPQLGLKPTEAYDYPDLVAADLTLDASVHDPSVFQDPKDGKYYAFGTHYAVASSTDLVNWEQKVVDEDYEGLYGSETYTKGSVSWPKALQTTVDLVNPISSGGDAVATTWAPDVNYFNGKYYMYYSLTKGFGKRESAIARVEADNVLGPYTNNTQIIDSMGGSGTDPNCIDPELFYDKEGKLWMVYGSDSGGIYILELYNSGEKMGLPKEDQGFGTRLWRGGSNQEGPFIFYNDQTDYYYLMVSYNSLLSNYNMHVARSKNPNGPYVGVDGKDLLVDGNGNKIAGNFKFERGGSQPGFAALGHNSVIKTAEGKYIAVYHARRVSGDSVDKAHKLYSAQIFFNEDGWPVLSPVRYAGETFGIVPEADVAETYEVVIHSTTAAVTATNSADYALTAEGKITKGSNEVGSWTLKDGYYITLTIDSVSYKGVIVPGWDMYPSASKQEARLCISAVSDAGVSLWAVAGKV